MQFQSFVLFLTISLTSCLPQLNERPYPYPLWRNRPRSIPSNSYYFNQPATYQNPHEISGYNLQKEYRYDGNRARGPFARHDDVKEVRIMNYPERASSDPMLNDQYSNTDFVFPGLANANYRTTASTTTTTTNRPIISSRSKFVPDIDAIFRNCPNTATFCESYDNYPSEYIYNALQESAAEFNDLFGKDELIPVVNISTRIGVGEEDGSPMCKANERVIQPPVAKNAGDEWKFIVNSDQYVQGIRVEICENAGKPCAMSQNFPLTYETECKQKYIFRKLLALDSSGEMQTDNFRLPSCCVCVFRSSRKARSVFGIK